MHWLWIHWQQSGSFLNGIHEGIMAMSLGFAVFPTAFSFGLVGLINGVASSVAPVSFRRNPLRTSWAHGTRFTRTVVDYLFRCESDVRDWLDRYSAAHRS